MGRGLSEQQVRILKSAVRRNGYTYPHRAQQVVASIAGLSGELEIRSTRDCNMLRRRLAIDAPDSRRNAIKASASRALRRLVERGLLVFEPASCKTFGVGLGQTRRVFRSARYSITDAGRRESFGEGPKVVNR